MTNQLRFPGWGLIIGAKPDAVRRFLARSHSEYAKDGVLVLEGTQGRTVFLSFIPDEPDEALGKAFAQDGKSVSLLDFNDEAPSVRDWDGKRFQFREDGRHPATVAEEDVGVVVPGYEPAPPSPVRHVSFAEGATLESVRPFIDPGGKVEALLGDGGVAIFGADPVRAKGFDAWEYAERQNARVFEISYDPRIAWLSCVVIHGGKVEGVFETERKPLYSDYPHLDSIRGESAPDGILRAFGIPPERILGE